MAFGTSNTWDIRWDRTAPNHHRRKCTSYSASKSTLDFFIFDHPKCVYIVSRDVTPMGVWGPSVLQSKLMIQIKNLSSIPSWSKIKTCRSMRCKVLTSTRAKIILKCRNFSLLFCYGEKIHTKINEICISSPQMGMRKRWAIVRASVSRWCSLKRSRLKVEKRYPSR